MTVKDTVHDLYCFLFSSNHSVSRHVLWTGPLSEMIYYRITVIIQKNLVMIYSDPRPRPCHGTGELNQTFSCKLFIHLHQNKIYQFIYKYAHAFDSLSLKHILVCSVAQHALITNVKPRLSALSCTCRQLILIT